MYKNDLMERALAGETLNRPPVWLMRQAGRTDPEYNKLKEEVKLTLEEMFSNPEIAAKVSLLPRKLGIDAMGQSKCGNDDTSHRMKIKQMLKDFEQNNPMVVTNIFRSLQRVQHDYLIDDPSLM